MIQMCIVHAEYYAQCSVYTAIDNIRLSLLWTNVSHLWGPKAIAAALRYKEICRVFSRL